MAHNQTDGIPEVSPTVTLAVRLPRAKAEQIRQQAADRGYKNLNQYLVAVLDLLGPIVKSGEQELTNAKSSDVATATESTL